MDIRSIICGAIACIALIGGIVLAALAVDAQQVALVFGIASTFGGYVVGLYSSPTNHAAPEQVRPGVDQIDQHDPDGVRDAVEGEEGEQ